MSNKKLITLTAMTCTTLSLSAGVNQKTFDNMDKDKDGVVSIVEYVKYRMGGFVQQDKNKDKFVEASEAWNPKWVENADKDGDGKASLEEAVLFHKLAAERQDKDGDGFLTWEELS